jgi:uncharacterized protein
VNWRAWNKVLHRDLGYLIFGMCIIYGISGIALNHRNDWNPNYIIRNYSFSLGRSMDREKINNDSIRNIIQLLDENPNFKKYYFPSSNTLRIFITSGSITLNLRTGEGTIETIRKRPIFKELNFLHYNNIKHAWTWFADLFGISLVFIAISGLFMVRGNKGITGRGAWLTLIGILIPLFFLLIYL